MHLLQEQYLVCGHANHNKHIICCFNQSQTCSLGGSPLRTAIFIIFRFYFVFLFFLLFYFLLLLCVFVSVRGFSQFYPYFLLFAHEFEAYYLLW